MRIALLISSLLICSTMVLGQNSADRLSRQIDSLVASKYKDVAPGCVILVASKDQIIYRKAFGLADTKTNKPMQPDMIFRLGSMTKQYTAVAILQLVEQGKIKLSDSIQVYVKDFPHKPYPITIENVLNQTSGIINFMEMTNVDPKKERDNYTPAQGVDYFKDEPLKFKPGSQFEYSNSNFFLLGYIIELVSGQTYGDYVKQHIIKQAGLKHTYYLNSGKAIPNMANGYSRFDKKHWEDAELQNVTMMYATGGLAANVEDVWQWHQALAKEKLINLPLLDKAYTAFQPETGPAQYGYGWFIKELDGLKTVEHSGSTDGYQTNEIYIPEKDLFVAAFFNGFETDMDWQIITNDVARLAMGSGLRQELKLTDDSLKRYVGTYQFNAEHQMVVSLKNHQLYVMATNPKDRLPILPLFAQSKSMFFIKEAPLRFEFQPDGNTHQFKLVTYNTSGKDAEWKRIDR